MTTSRLTSTLAATTLALGAALTACSSGDSEADDPASGSSASSSAAPSPASDSASASASTASGTASAVWDASTVHDVSVELDEDEYAALVATYEETGEKEWISVDVTIDGTSFQDAGLRLKGNSSLRSVEADADPADLPWLIDLDKFVDGQNLEGWEKLVIRSNNSETSLNEAVALDLLQEAGLAASEAVATRFSVNGGDQVLRLMVQDLDDAWQEASFDGAGILYKSEAGGDWSYRGDDAAAYEDVFDVEAGEEDYAPLTDFLQWLDESSDEEFAEDLDERIDVEAFATYLAFEDLVGNSDDIEGPGNNSYLRWDAGTGEFTVVAWDHNLAFGGMGGMGGMGGGPGGGERPEGATPPEGFEPPANGEVPEGFEPPAGGEGFGAPGGGSGGGPRGGNVLAERFRANDEFAALYDEATATLQAELFESGTAQEILDRWTAVLTEQASDVVGATTVAEEAQRIASYLDGQG